MKKQIFFFILPLLIMPACIKKTTEKAGSCCSTHKKENTIVEVSGESLYNLDSEWVSQADKRCHLRDFSGKIVVAAMIFTNCESACPRIVADMKRIEQSLSGNELEQMLFLLISMDPERDTPPQLRNFAFLHQLNSHWTLISSSPGATLETANALGFRYKKLENGSFDHSNNIYILNGIGEVEAQQNGFSENLNTLSNKIREMLNH